MDDCSIAQSVAARDMISFKHSREEEGRRKGFPLNCDEGLSILLTLFMTRMETVGGRSAEEPPREGERRRQLQQWIPLIRCWVVKMRGNVEEDLDDEITDF